MMKTSVLFICFFFVAQTSDGKSLNVESKTHRYFIHMSSHSIASANKVCLYKAPLTKDAKLDLRSSQPVHKHYAPFDVTKFSEYTDFKNYMSFIGIYGLIDVEDMQFALRDLVEDAEARKFGETTHTNRKLSQDQYTALEHVFELYESKAEWRLKKSKSKEKDLGNCPASFPMH